MVDQEDYELKELSDYPNGKRIEGIRDMSPSLQTGWETKIALDGYSGMLEAQWPGRGEPYPAELSLRLVMGVHPGSHP